ncbi:putative transcription factor WD40-like family [Rosa chinensis]|uniref:Putative transcription factor WD40-like family n=1 Tax=Rosa chinensis TaxID=74649 RepID=A0A2P6PLK7_ROSCH|nr:putative transcription factor WD40-like family [Rosa chinensis]
MFLLNNVVINDDESRAKDSDDSEIDFSSPLQEHGSVERLSNVFSGGNRLREYMTASLPRLRILDNLPIRKIDQETARMTFSEYFEHVPYQRKHKENVISVLQKREIRSSQNHVQSPAKKVSNLYGKSQCFYTRSLSAAKMGSCDRPFLNPLSFSGITLVGESKSFRPRQFEYHPSNSSLMVFGTLDGEIVAVNHENGKIVSYIPSLGAMNSVLGLCLLKKYPSKLIAGSDNGSLKLYDIHHMRSVETCICGGAGSVSFDEFDQLTSVHVNSTDELFLASGYSRDVALYDISSGKCLQVLTNMHREHINVMKFAKPSVFAASSFDQDVKMWDLRQKPISPCYSSSSSRGNVMVCFSPDDHYLLVSAVDNEVRQLLAVDGRLHLNFEIASTGSSQNYTRSYYMNGRDYIISGSCDEHVVRICCAQTGRRLRDISLEAYYATRVGLLSDVKISTVVGSLCIWVKDEEDLGVLCLCNL